MFLFNIACGAYAAKIQRSHDAAVQEARRKHMDDRKPTPPIQGMRFVVRNGEITDPLEVNPYTNKGRGILGRDLCLWNSTGFWADDKPTERDLMEVYVKPKHWGVALLEVAERWETEGTVDKANLLTAIRRARAAYEHEKGEANG